MCLLQMQTSTRVTLTFPNEHLTDFDMQTKIEQISPLPFPFHILHTSSVIWMARISFVLISTLIILVIFPSIFLIIIGTVCYLHSYHPMDRSKLSDKVWRVEFPSKMTIWDRLSVDSASDNPAVLDPSAAVLLGLHAHLRACVWRALSRPADAIHASDGCIGQSHHHRQCCIHRSTGHQQRELQTLTRPCGG